MNKFLTKLNKALSINRGERHVNSQDKRDGYDPYHKETAPVERIGRAFKYHRPTGDQTPRYQTLRLNGQNLALLIEDHCPESYEREIAINKLKESIMWANASIAMNELDMDEIELKKSMKKQWEKPEVREATDEEIINIKEKMNNEQA